LTRSYAAVAVAAIVVLPLLVLAGLNPLVLVVLTLPVVVLAGLAPPLVVFVCPVPLVLVLAGVTPPALALAGLAPPLVFARLVPLALVLAGPALMDTCIKYIVSM
jgi:hypothetical protein